MRVQAPNSQNEANSFLKGSGTESGHRTGDLTGPGRRIPNLFDLGQVHAGAEGLPVTGKQDGRYGRVGGSFIQRTYESAAQSSIEGVSLLGTIEGKPQKAPLANGMQNVGHCAQVGGR